MSKKLQGGLCPQSQTTNHQSLPFALQKVHSYGITNNQLDNNYKLHVCRQTLAKIEKGQLPAGKEQHYMGALVRTLNNLRLQAIRMKNNHDEATITRDMLEILLVSFGIATDGEMAEREREKHRKEILQNLGVNITGSR